MTNPKPRTKPKTADQPPPLETSERRITILDTVGIHIHVTDDTHTLIITRYPSRDELHIPMSTQVAAEIRTQWQANLP